jgi:hypothetical protein
MDGKTAIEDEESIWRGLKGLTDEVDHQQFCF